MKVYSGAAVAEEVRALLAAADAVGASRNAIVPLDLLRAVRKQLEGEETATAECERLRGLLAIAREGLGAAAKDVLDGRTGPEFAFNALEALRRSNPCACCAGDASPEGMCKP